MPPSPDPDRFTYHNDGLTFDVSSWGPEDGELAVLLHGFPEDASSWRDVAPALAAAGYRVVAPDQRGYSPEARPQRRRDYAMPKLVGDVVALADHLGVSRFHLVGHDWGGAVAWGLGLQHTERLASLTVLSTPHPQAMAASMLRSTQLLRSWYMLFFQLPLLPERATQMRRFRDALVESGLPEAHADSYTDMLRAGAARYALNWYRAIPFAGSGAGRVNAPTMYVYSTGDTALGKKAADLTGRYVGGTYRYEVIGGSHWIPEEQPELTAELLLDHIRSHPV